MTCRGANASAGCGSRRQTHGPAYLGRAPEDVMGDLYRGETREDVRRHRGAPARVERHVQGHQLVGGGEIPFGRVVHRVDVVQTLGVVREELRRETEWIALAHFAV